MESSPEKKRKIVEKGDLLSYGGAASQFCCCICLDMARDPVVTDCGHLYCWQCLYKWIHFPDSTRKCPVCKSAVEIETDAATVTPIYGCFGFDGAGGDTEAPSRPPGKRSRRLRGAMVMELLDEIMEFAEIRSNESHKESADRARATFERMRDRIVAMDGIVREYSRSTARSNLHIALVTLIPNSGRGADEEGSGSRGVDNDGVYQNTRSRTRRRLERETES